LSDTIAAIATGGSVSAIGIVRISGSEALTVADNVFRSSCGIKLTSAENRRMYYGELMDSDGALIDLCLCTAARGPNSYTGEDTVEFHCHGSPVVLSEVLCALFAQGVRHAESGEFTKRAFLNGRLDLTQAEAVIDLIEAETTTAAKNAAGQLRGAIGVRMESLYSSLLDIVAHFHAVIDYPDEDIDEFDVQKYLSKLKSAEDELQRMLDTHERSRVLRDGIPTAIVGRPNTGKSSLLNAMLGYERAIVTNVAGTTRDTIEEKLLFGGVLLRLIDTAGLRKTEDTVEKLGVERALEAIRNAKLVILVLDGSEPLTTEDFDALCLIPPDVQKIAVVNKSDLPSTLTPAELAELGINCCRVSALTGDGLDLLDGEIRKMFPVFEMSPSGELITNIRQAEAISRATTHIRLAATALTDAVTPDAVLTDIEAALAAIGEVTGKAMREDIISRIFERFCVGK
jgi:tRNA modification GTPase